jgi:tripartite-type tricarboxylate transporter receptor subunit TctC
MKIMKSPDVVEKLEKINSYSVGSTPEEFAHFMHQEQIKWSKVIREGNIQPD